VTHPIRSLGVGYLAAQLRARGHDVSVVNCPITEPDWSSPPDPRVSLNSETLATKIRHGRIDVAGISCTFAHYFPYVLAIARQVKAVDVPVVVGGSHPTLCPNAVLQHRDIDVVVLGEGERTFCDLVDSGFSLDALARIDGLAYRKHGDLVISPRRQYIDDLDSIPFLFRTALY
jgi:magnesium-protoporphyrin IX monomethyl ester (oxidative) cyclase